MGLCLQSHFFPPLPTPRRGRDNWPLELEGQSTGSGSPNRGNIQSSFPSVLKHLHCWLLAHFRNFHGSGSVRVPHYRACSRHAKRPFRERCGHRRSVSQRRHHLRFLPLFYHALVMLLNGMPTQYEAFSSSSSGVGQQEPRCYAVECNHPAWKGHLKQRLILRQAQSPRIQHPPALPTNVQPSRIIYMTGLLENLE